MVLQSPHVDIRRADDRFATRLPWLYSHHSFSFGNHWDAANTHFGLLLVSNDDIVRPGTGFETHPHRDMEIVTWVLRGSLVHQDSEGNKGIIYPGLAQRMSAGTGILHSEKNDAWKINGQPVHDDPVRFIQMWVVPDQDGIEPGYEQLDIEDQLLRGGLVPVASGMAGHRDATAIRIKQKGRRPLRLPHGPGLLGAPARRTIRPPLRGPRSRRPRRRRPTGGRRRGADHRSRRTDGDGRRDAEILVWEMRSELPEGH
jgi:redox-sensitive bicupin YhaK (pirin superfamily)